MTCFLSILVLHWGECRDIKHMYIFLFILYSSTLDCSFWKLSTFTCYTAQAKRPKGKKSTDGPMCSYHITISSELWMYGEAFHSYFHLDQALTT